MMLVPLRRQLTSVAAILTSMLLIGAGLAPTATAESSLPPGIPSAPEAQSQLDELSVEPESDGEDYDRDLFPHWRVVDSPCSARQYVLERDGQDVQTDQDCQPTSGEWHSAYDDEWTEDASSFDIDHLVALGEAWVSGADSWTTEERTEFANDVELPQLWVATPESNGAKSDLDPAEWLPEQTELHCAYVKSWITVKHDYDLSVDSAEHTAMQDVLDTAC